VEKIPRKMTDQLYSYLRNSIYQLGFFINFSSDGVDIKRVIYTNDRKKHIISVSDSQCRSEAKSLQSCRSEAEKFSEGKFMQG
jgi:hypothetical protein